MNDQSFNKQMHTKERPSDGRDRDIHPDKSNGLTSTGLLPEAGGWESAPRGLRPRVPWTVRDWGINE